MLIDVHTHLWPKINLTDNIISYFKSRKIWDDKQSILSSERLLKIMDDNNIEKSIVLSAVFSPDTDNAEIYEMNLYVSKQVAIKRDRLLGFFTVNPFFKKEALRLSQKSIEELGLCGLKIHPSFQEISPNDKKLYPFYEKMQEYRLPVLFHSGSIGIKPFKDFYSNPSLIDEVACDFPELTIIIGHAGKIWHKETAMLFRKHKNVFADISTNIGRSPLFSEHPMAWLLYITKSYADAIDRLMFGTDYPLYMQDETIECLKKAAELVNRQYPGFITGEDIEKIMYKNALKLLEKINNK